MRVEERGIKKKIEKERKDDWDIKGRKRGTTVGQGSMGSGWTR